MPRLLDDHGQRGAAGDRAIGTGDGEGVGAGGRTRGPAWEGATTTTAAAHGQQSDAQRDEAEHRKPQRTPTGKGDQQHTSERDPAPSPINSVAGLFALALVAAVVETVTVAVCAAVPEMLTEAGTEQVGLLEPVAPLERAQVRLTDPPNPLDGVTVRVDVPD